MKHCIRPGEGRDYWGSMKRIIDLQMHDLESKKRTGNVDNHTIAYLQAVSEIGHCIAAHMLLSKDPIIREKGNELSNIAALANIVLFGIGRN